MGMSTMSEEGAQEGGEGKQEAKDLYATWGLDANIIELIQIPSILAL